jgi:uncharacterized protein (UPF0297 family)
MILYEELIVRIYCIRFYVIKKDNLLVVELLESLNSLNEKGYIQSNQIVSQMHTIVLSLPLSITFEMQYADIKVKQYQHNMY